MIRIAFTDESVAALHELQRHPHHVVRHRALMLILKSQEIAHHKIAKITDVCENTVRHWLETYQQGGLEKLTDISFYQPQSGLKPFEMEVRDYFDKTPPATIAQACADIGERTGVILNPSLSFCPTKSYKNNQLKK